MSIIDLVAEARIKDWETKKGLRKDNPHSIPAASESALASTGFKRFESYLMQDIRDLLAQAALIEAPHQTSLRKELLDKAWELEMQMLSALEKQGYFHLSKSFADTLRAYKQELNLRE